MTYGFYATVGKRLFDIVISLASLIFLSPLFLIVALIVWHEIGFPIFFKQERMGYFGQKFTIYKFRTMIASDNPRSAKKITRNTRLLRWIGLDELPQLINILRGEMSLVGPRPEIAEWFRMCKNHRRYHARFNVKPGLIPILLARDITLKGKHKIYSADCDYAMGSITFIGDIRYILKAFLYLIDKNKYTETKPVDAIEIA